MTHSDYTLTPEMRVEILRRVAGVCAKHRFDAELTKDLQDIAIKCITEHLDKAKARSSDAHAGSTA